jgi:hypothetical protein
MESRVLECGCDAAAVVHNSWMADDGKEHIERDGQRDVGRDSDQQHDTQAYFEEAVERTRRLRVWLDGMLGGGPQPSETTGEWRQEMAFYQAQAQLPVDDDDVKVKPIEETLFEVGQGIRNRREAAGKPLDAISEEERKRRFLEVVELLKKDGAEGKEATPMHLVLAARYVEGEMDLEEYGRAVLRV